MSALDLACGFFRQQRQSGSLPPQYIFHLPRKHRSHVGLGHHKVIRYSRQGFRIETKQGTEQRVASDTPLRDLRQLIDPTRPCFVMISSDLARNVDDPALPLILCVQPEFEAIFSGFDGESAPASTPLPRTSESWQTQPDSEFLKRLEWAVSVLNETPGKMIITRPYQKSVGDGDRLALFDSFAHSEPGAACSHFLRVDEQTHSLGCSPENIFEVDNGRLIFDVVAATRGISPDPDVDQKWLAELQTDPKERREHLMAFDRYKARLETLIEPGSGSVDLFLQVLRLGTVRHLYSKLSGQLRADLDWLDMLEGSFPPLNSYPEELARLTDIPDEPNRYYAGVVGRIAPGGDHAALFLNLRAGLVTQSTLFTQGGIGVIAGSVPKKELLEVNNKLRGLKNAVDAWLEG